MIKRIRAAFAAFFVVGTIVATTPASAVPLICVMPTSGTVPGLTLVNDINNCLGSALALFAGGSTPDSPTTGMLWWNTSTGYVAQWDGAGWNNLWNVDTTNHLNAVQIGGGVQASLASASVIELWSVPAASVAVTGTSTISQLANGHAVPGTVKIVTFAGALTLTQGGGTGGTPLNLPNNGGNIVTAPGDYAIVLALTSTNVQVIQYTRATGAALSTFGLNVGASALAQSALGYEAPLNLQLAAAVSGNSLTVSVLGVNGSNPSSPANPVLVNFRSTTLNNGSNGIVYGQITSALSFQVTSGFTMGCTTAVVCRLWVTLICRTESSGSCSDIRLGLSNQSTATQVFPLAEDVLQTTGSGTSGGLVAGMIQANVASMSGVAIRIAGYVEVTWSSGTGWATTPSKIQVFGPGVHKPGDVVQTIEPAFITTTTACLTSSTGSTITANITPTSVVNLVRATAIVTGTTGSAQTGSARLARNNSLLFGMTGASGGGGIGTGGVNSTVTVRSLDAPATTSAVNYTIYCTSNVNGGYIAGTGGGSDIVLDEIMGALDLEKMSPANDAAAPLRLVG